MKSIFVKKGIDEIEDNKRLDGLCNIGINSPTH